MGAGLLGSFIVRVLLYSGTKRIGASRMSPIFRSDILVASAVAIFLMGEEITPIHLLGILFLTVGIMLISWEIETDDTTSRFKVSLNLLIPFAAMFFSGLSRPIAKLGLSENTPVVVGLAIKFLTALIALSLYFLSQGRSVLRPLESDERNLYFGAGLMGSVPMILFYTSLNVSRVVVMMPFRSLTPFFVLVISYFFLQRLEKITKLPKLGCLSLSPKSTGGWTNRDYQTVRTLLLILFFR
ncbi:hypothetical protein AKJ64_03970 [candidate division MSBL1 archaeon SCGC-AAA259E17]|uniref:EamA domain-containing protein n=1 Tax=candidate division MSBL1 archaeon SCGC-AAA259E17 TaxID=1698263 RepID=A0A133UD80_9EURY|nr:hypothetical protein AKJ64_03970 [candidate division MSBL1 archaeon SCGC-AAA259E17]